MRKARNAHVRDAGPLRELVSRNWHCQNPVESDNPRLNKVVIRLTSDYRAGLWDLDAAADARQRAACLLACSPHHPTPCAPRGWRARIIRRLGRQAKFGFDFGDACPKRGVLRNQSVDPPISATINASFSGESVSGKTVIAKFDDGLLSSDGGCCARPSNTFASPIGSPPASWTHARLAIEP
jgi:hypothetical protein